VSDDELAEAVHSGKLTATADMAELARMDVVDICVPTPLRKTRDPDLSYVVKAVEAVAAAMRPGRTIQHCEKCSRHPRSDTDGRGDASKTPG
jgi:UDP-N-acetyl-D-glucosamine dehydrogenase